jgi:beta-fructofuranosidase
MRVGASSSHIAGAMHDERPRLHLTPPSGWMNDPNGMFFIGGQLHVTYQHNPEASEWGRMSWGHAVSRDLLHWDHLPIALTPGTDGPDAFGCWSGCIVERGSAGGVLFYTGVRLEGDARVATICRATSADADRRAWLKDPRGPVIEDPPEGITRELFRDPFVWLEDGEWQMVVGAGTPDGSGAILLYRSPDLEQWRYAGRVLTSDELDAATDGHAPMWECPQLLSIGGWQLLIMSVVDPAPSIRPSHVVALVGRFTDGRFRIDHGRRLEMGPDLYAPSTVHTPDGRWMVFGWIPEDPPDPASDRTWAGALTFPRIVSITDRGRISLALAPEIAHARGRGTRSGPHALVPHGDPLTADLPPGPFELALDVRPRAGADVRISLHDTDPADPLARISYHEREQQLVVARRGIVSVAGRSSMSAATVAPDATGSIYLRILVDGSILELEANGDTMATARLVHHPPADRRIVITTDAGDAIVDRFELWPLRVD